jgi:transposase
VHDELVAHGWEVLVADAQRVKGLAPLACKTDKIDARVLAELSVRDLVPAIWLPTVELRREREISRYRLHLARHRTTLKNRVQSTLICFGHQVPIADLFGVAGRRLLAGLDVPEPWRGHVDASLELTDDLERRIGQIETELKRAGAEHRYVPLLMTAPGFGWITSFTVACEIGDINRFSSPVKLTGYTGLCPRVSQSGDMDRRGPSFKHGPRYLRWGLMEAAIHAAAHPLFPERYRIRELLDGDGETNCDSLRGARVALGRTPEARGRPNSAGLGQGREPVAALGFGQLAGLGHVVQRRADGARGDARDLGDLGRGHRLALLQGREDLGLVLTARRRRVAGGA